MIKLGIKGLEGLKFKYEFEDEIKWTDKVKTVHDLGQVGYKFDPDFVDEYLDLGANGKIEIAQQMPQGLPKDDETAKNVINNMPWFTYLHKIEEMRNDKSKMEDLKKFYKKHK